MLRQALAGFPTRPALYLAVAVVVVALGYHFATTYRTCSAHAALRDDLRRAIAASAAGGGPVRLAAVTGFDWDRADILVDYKPTGRVADCPFQWDWSGERRRELIAKGLLTVVVFARDGKLVDYLEYRRDRAEFADIRNPYTPDTAVFDAAPSRDAPGTMILKPAP